MSSCPSCGRRPIRRKNGVRQCRRCGVLPELLAYAAAVLQAAVNPVRMALAAAGQPVPLTQEPM